MHFKTSMSLVLASLLLLAGAVHAAEPYPNRPITLIIPYQTGSDTDSFGRLLGTVAQNYLNQHTIGFENKVGDQGIVASLFVRSAPTDGHTLLIARVGTHAIAPNLVLQRPYEPQDFTTLAIISTNPMVCAVRSDGPFKTSRDLLDALRKKPGTLKYSTVGSGTIQNLAAQYLLSLAGAKPDAAQALHLNTATEATQALIEARADFVCNNANTVLPAILAGKVRGLFTTSPTRLPQAPALPTAREVGLRDMGQIQGWTALMGPTGLSSASIHYWKALLPKIAKDPVWIEGITKMGAQSTITTIKDPQQYLIDQHDLYEQLITLQGLRK